MSIYEHGVITMVLFERHKQILALLDKNQFCSVENMAKELFTSPATIRRDLSRLEQDGAIHRVRGGAIRIEGRDRDAPPLVRNNKDKDKKEKIARLAQRFVSSGATMFLDSSSTVTEFARLLAPLHELTIMTNGLETLNLLNQTSARVLSPGGEIQNRSSFVGQTAIRSICEFHADILFFSCCGLSVQFGSSEATEGTAAIKRAMLDYSAQHIMLCDSSKFDTDYFRRVCSLKEIDAIITDCRPSEKFMNAVPCQVIYE